MTVLVCVKEEAIIPYKFIISVNLVWHRGFKVNNIPYKYDNQLDIFFGTGGLQIVLKYMAGLLHKSI